MSNHSYYVGANVNPDTNSFRNWMEKTNRMIYDLSTGVVMLAANSTGETTSGNGYVGGRFGADTLIAGTALRGGTVATPNTLNISSDVNIANTLVVANGITGDLTGTANNAANLGGQPASYYANASNLSSGTVPNARLPSANTTQQGIVQIVDSVSNTSITHAASANSVKQAYDAVTSAAAAAYANAVAVAANASNLANGTVPTARLPSANTTQAGITQLADSYANTSQTNPPTAKALNDLYVLYSSSAIPPENLPAANTTSAGIVMLVAGTANTSNTHAATPFAVKTAYDAAIAANTLAANAHTAAANASYLANGTVPNARLNSSNTSQAGIVQLSDSVASTSIALAATANAAKTAYDAAIAANTLAANAHTAAANATYISNGTLAGARMASANSTVQGAVIVLDSVVNTSITVAASANSAKRAYDTAISANTLAANAHTAAANGSYITNGTVAGARMASANTTVQGAVVLIDSVSNTSITGVPTANNVKTAYDAAITANTNAANASFLANGTVPTARLATTLQNLINSTGISGTVTVSTSDPSGGANNDIWLKRSA